MATRTLGQNKTLHKLLKELRYDEAQKEALILGYTENRVSSSRYLTIDECSQINVFLQSEVNRLKTKQSADKSLKKYRAFILSKFTEIGFLIPVPAGEKQDYSKVNAWMKTHSYLKKGLWEYTLAEIRDLSTQVNAMANAYINKD